MAMRKVFGTMSAGAWDWPISDEAAESTESPANSLAHSPSPQTKYPTLAERNHVGTKRKAGRVDLSETASEPNVKKNKTQPVIKREELDDTPWNFEALKNDGVIDLTMDSSDDEIIVTSSSAKKPVIQTPAASKVQPTRTEPVQCFANASRTISPVPTPTLPPHQAKELPTTINLSGSATDEDSKPHVAPEFKVPCKPKITSGPFHCDSDSDSSEDEAEPTPAASFPVPKSSSPLPSSLLPPSHVPEVKFTFTQEEKDAQLKRAAELREEARARKAARALEPPSAPEEPSPNAQRPVMKSVEGYATPTTQATPLPAQKTARPSKVVRRKEPGRMPAIYDNTSKAAAYGLHGLQREAHNTQVSPYGGAPPSNATDHADLATFASPESQAAAETPRPPSNQAVSLLQRAISNNAQFSKPKTQSLHASTSSPEHQDSTKQTRLPETIFTSQPSLAANGARTHVEALKQANLSIASSSGSEELGGLSQEQNEELFGDESLVVVEENAAPNVGPKQVIIPAAQESLVARATKQDAAHKAELAQALSKAEKDSARSDEQRRRIEANKARNEQRKAQEALDQQREAEERSRQARQKRLEREAAEQREAEQRRASQAKLEEANRRKQADDAERKRKALEARKKESPAPNAEQQQQKADRIRKQRERSARLGQAAQADAEAESAREDEDSGELVLESEPLGGFGSQASKHTSTVPTVTTGPVSLNSAAGTNLVKQTILQHKPAKPLTVEQRIQREKQNWNVAKDVTSKTTTNNVQGGKRPFFTPHPPRKQPNDQSAVQSSEGSTPARDEKKKHGRKLFPVLPEDAKLLEWRDKENMDWDDILSEFEKLTGRRYVESTLRKRYRQMSEAVKEAKIPFSLMQSLADQDEDAQDEVTLLMQEAGLDHSPEAAGAVKLPLQGGGPLKLGPLGLQANGSPMWQHPTLDLGRKDDPVVHKPRTAITIRHSGRQDSPETQDASQERPTIARKSLNVEFYEKIMKDHFEEKLEYPEPDPETDDDEEEQSVDWQPEDFLEYGFQVQRRELPTEAAEEGFPIENEPWLPCVETFTGAEEAASAASAEIETILPGGPFYADMRIGFTRQCYDDPTTGLPIYNLVNPIHGQVQTRVAKVLQTPRARDQPPTRTETKRELNNRQLWHVYRRLTIETPVAEDDLFGDKAPPPRVVDMGKILTYSDPDLANKRAAQAFVDYTFKSSSLSLDTRSEEKNARVEGYLGGILAGKMFEGEMKISRDMERSTEVWTKFDIDEYNGSKVILNVWIEDGVLFGPTNF